MEDEEMDGSTEADTGTGDRRLDRAIALLRADVRLDAAAFDARVLAAIRQHEIGASARQSDDIPRSRSRSRGHARVGAWIAAAAIAASVAIATSVHEGQRTGAAQPLSTAASTAASVSVAAPKEMRLVHFHFSDAHAAKVVVAGSFNGWSTSTTPLRRVGDTTWVADVPLRAGRHVYQFVIDNHRWVADPAAPRDPGDDFGSSNSVVTVAMRSRS